MRNVAMADAPGAGMTVASEAYDVFVSYSRADWRHATEIDSGTALEGPEAVL